MVLGGDRRIGRLGRKYGLGEHVHPADHLPGDSGGACRSAPGAWRNAAPAQPARPRERTRIPAGHNRCCQDGASPRCWIAAAGAAGLGRGSGCVARQSETQEARAVARRAICCPKARHASSTGTALDPASLAQLRQASSDRGDVCGRGAAAASDDARACLSQQYRRTPRTPPRSSNRRDDRSRRWATRRSPLSRLARRLRPAASCRWARDRRCPGHN